MSDVYVDSSGDATTTYTYRVSATNGVGTSCGTNAVLAAPVGGSCDANGLRILNDAAGDQIGVPLEGDMDIQWISIGEPFFADGSRKLVFKMKVASLVSLKPHVAHTLELPGCTSDREPDFDFIRRPLLYRYECE